MATNATIKLDALHWSNLEMQFAVGNRWRLGTETWIVEKIFYNRIGRAAVCRLEGNPKDIARFPIAAMVRTADKIEARAKRAA